MTSDRQPREIVIEVFDTFVETEPEYSTTLLQKVRDVILYRLEKETIEMNPVKLGVYDGEQEFTPDEIGPAFGTSETAPEDITLGEEPIWESPGE